MPYAWRIAGVRQGLMRPNRIVLGTAAQQMHEQVDSHVHNMLPKELPPECLSGDLWRTPTAGHQVAVLPAITVSPVQLVDVLISGDPVKDVLGLLLFEPVGRRRRDRGRCVGLIRQVLEMPDII